MRTLSEADDTDLNAWTATDTGITWDGYCAGATLLKASAAIAAVVAATAY